MVVLFALIIGLCATAASAQDLTPVTPLEIYDHYSNNSLEYDTFSSLFLQKGSISFDKLNYVYSPYSADNPVLVVHKPTETSHELHGYYFPEGFASFASYGGADYEPIRTYFHSKEFEAYTPFAARYAHPYFFEYDLTKFVHGTEFSPIFNVVFLVPRVAHPLEYVTSYNSIFAVIPN